MGRRSDLWQGNCPDRLKVAGRAVGNLAGFFPELVDDLRCRFSLTL
jgi:hypothetical protein